MTQMFGEEPRRATRRYLRAGGPNAGVFEGFAEQRDLTGRHLKLDKKTTTESTDPPFPRFAALSFLKFGRLFR